MSLLGRPPKLVSLHITVWSTEKTKLERLAKMERLSLSAYLRRVLAKLLYMDPKNAINTKRRK